MSTEQQLQAEILLALGARRDLKIWRINCGTSRSWDEPRAIKGAPAGHADLAGILADGRALYIEVKTAKGRQSEPQVRFEAMVKKFKGVYILARSVDEAQAGVDLALACQVAS
jgi:hypothetical protein